MILSKKTHEEHHENGKLKYIETICILAPMFSRLFVNRRVSDVGIEWIRIGLCAKYYDNGITAWELHYDDNGGLIGSANKHRKDGSPVIH